MICQGQWNAKGRTDKKMTEGSNQTGDWELEPTVRESHLTQEVQKSRQKKSSCSWFSSLGETYSTSASHITWCEKMRGSSIFSLLLCGQHHREGRQCAGSHPFPTPLTHPPPPSPSLRELQAAFLQQASLSILLALWCHFLLAIQVCVLIQYDEPERNTEEV